jgi:hypothetical protein
LILIQEPTPKETNRAISTAENQQPLALFTYIPLNPAVNDEILFDAASSTDSDGQIILFIWDFGDTNSTTTNQSLITHSFATTGDFIITLKVIDNLGATSSPTATTITITNIIQETATLSVVINEIAWMGTEASSADEWIELYNNTTSTIDIEGWHIISSDGSPDILFSTSTSITTTIPVQEFYLIERTDDNTISDIPADWVGSFGKGLSNSECELLFLYDKNDNLIDKTACLESKKWPAGEASPGYVTMERIDTKERGSNTENWANNNLITQNGLDIDGNSIYGTPKAENSVSKPQTEILRDLPFNDFDEVTLTYLSSPYIIKSTITVPKDKTLKIEPGVILKFHDSKEIEIKGILEAIGGEKEEEKIVFTRNSTSAPLRDRYRLHFINSLNSKLENIKFIEGGRLTYAPFYAPWGMISGVIEIEDSEVSIKNCLILESFPLGIHISNSVVVVEEVEFSKIQDSADFKASVALLIEGSSPTVKNSTFRENTIGMKIIGDASPQIEDNIFEENGIPIYLSIPTYPVFLNNRAQNNNLNGIFVGGGDITSDTVWQADLPYVINGKVLREGATLSLKEGTIVKFELSGYLEIRGRIITEGVSTNPVVITSILDDEFGDDTNNDGDSTFPNEGNWKFIKFSTSSSILEGIIIRYSGGGCYTGSCWGAITQLKGVEIQIKNSIIEKSIWGIFSNEADCDKALENLRLENVTFSDNERDISLIKGVTCKPP